MFKKSLIALALVGAAASAQAASVSCGDASLGDREVTVTGAATGGYCYAQNGNFIGDNFSVVPGSETLLLKNNDSGMSWGADFVGGALSGNWTVSSTLRSAYDKLYLAFHFGGGGECGVKGGGGPNAGDPNSFGLPGEGCEVDPDSFIVELDGAAISGTWSTNFTQWGLSNLYLVGECTQPNGCGSTEVPIPGTLGLLGLGLVGLGLVRRKQQA
jgi:hypothetical protein